MVKNLAFIIGLLFGGFFAKAEVSTSQIECINKIKADMLSGKLRMVNLPNSQVDDYSDQANLVLAGNSLVELEYSFSRSTSGAIESISLE